MVVIFIHCWFFNKKFLKIEKIGAVKKDQIVMVRRK